jgi:hypothetical protein
MGIIRPTAKQEGDVNMTIQNQHLLQSLDTANFKTLLENGGKAVANEAALRTAHQTALRTQIEQIAEYAKAGGDAEFARANKALLDQGANVETWFGGPGDFSFAGTKAWALGGGIPFLGSAPLSFLFGATGDSWKAWGAGTCVILGSFVVDPEKVVKSNEFHTENSPIGRVRKGFCNFTASGGGIGISGVNISFYSTGGTFWGSFSGSGAFGGGFSVEGKIELVWQGWH